MFRYLPLAVDMVALVAGLSSPNEITIADFYRRPANGDAGRLTQHLPLEQEELLSGSVPAG